MIVSIVQRSSMQMWGLFLLVLSLVGCDRSLDLKATETKLKEELTKQGVGSLKQVNCPEVLPIGKAFTCTGIFESGIGFAIPVEHQEDGDKLKAEIPSIKGMLNMDQVLKAIREELKMGEGATIDCAVSSPYRMVTLGSTFECTLMAKTEALPTLDKLKTVDKIVDGKDNKLPMPAVKEPDKIEIAIASSGDVTWQRMVAAAPGSIKLGDSVKSNEKTGDKPGIEDPEKSSTAAPIAPKKKTTPPADSGDVPYDS